MASLPTNFSNLRKDTVQKGTRLHRVHNAKYGASQFNDTSSGNARFSPIKSANGQIIASIYAGSTLDCALMETVFHNSGSAASVGQVQFSDIEQLRCSEIELVRDIVVADLSSKALRSIGLSRSQLIDTPGSQYPVTRDWAEHLLSSNPDVEGFRWTSRQDDEAQAFVFFDRGGNGSFFKVKSSKQAGRRPVFSEIAELAEFINVCIVMPNSKGSAGRF